MSNVVTFPVREVFAAAGPDLSSQAAVVDTRRLVALLAGAEARRITDTSEAASAASEHAAVARFRSVLRAGGINAGDAGKAMEWFRSALKQELQRQARLRNQAGGAT